MRTTLWGPLQSRRRCWLCFYNRFNTVFVVSRVEKVLICKIIISFGEAKEEPYCRKQITLINYERKISEVCMTKHIAVHFLGYFHQSTGYMFLHIMYVLWDLSLAFRYTFMLTPTLTDLCETLSRQESFQTRLAAKPEMCLKRKQETEAASKMFSGKFI